MTAIVNPIGIEHGLVYTITGPDGTRAVINDRTDADYVGFLNPRDGGGVTGLERAGVREAADTLPDADGGVHGVFRRDRLTFTLGGIIPPDSPVGADTWLGRQAKLLRATDALAGDAVLTWDPSEAPPVQVAFRAQQATRIAGARPKTFLVAGVSEEPVVFSQALHAAAIVPSGAVGGGFTSPLDSPLGSSATSVGAVAVDNAGSVETWPVLELVGPCVNPSIINTTLGLGLQFLYTLAAGETLEIDTNPRRRTIKLNGVTNRYSAVYWAASDWFPLAPGVNVLNLGFTSYSSPAGLTVQWRDAWG